MKPRRRPVDKAEFLRVVETLTDFYDRTPPKKQLEAWYWKIKHLDAGIASDAADEVTSNLAMFPTPAKFLEFADQVRSRKTAIGVRQGDNQARRFFDEKAPEGFAKDCVVAINELLSVPKGDARAFLKTKYEVANRVLEKYPHMTEEAKAPLKTMIRGAKEEFRKILNQEEWD